MSENRSRQKLIAIVGPTASGKTAVAVSLAKRINGEIISADSMQVYRGMNIGTAKATIKEMDGIPHHLIDIIDPSEPFSVAEYQRRARFCIDDIAGRGKVPILAGGTGLYVRAVIDKFEFPAGEATSELRRQLEERAGIEGGGALYGELVEKDPLAADIVHPKNVRRIIRALEVIEETGRPFSEHYREWHKRESLYDVEMFGLDMSRAVLHQRINERVEVMVACGFIDEVKSLRKQGYDGFLTSQQAIGYKELVGYLRGDISLEDAIETIKARTRQYAKRQLTWFRADPRVQWVDATGRTIDEIVDFIVNKLAADAFIQ